MVYFTTLVLFRKTNLAWIFIVGKWTPVNFQPRVKIVCYGTASILKPVVLCVWMCLDFCLQFVLINSHSGCFGFAKKINMLHDAIDVMESTFERQRSTRTLRFNITDWFLVAKATLHLNKLYYLFKLIVGFRGWNFWRFKGKSQV